MGRNLREYFWPAAVTLVCLALSGLLHSRFGFWSPLQIGDVVWLKKLNLHLTVYPYTIRPFQTWSTVWLHDLTSLPIRESFVIIQFGLSFLLGLVFYAFLKRLDFGRAWTLVGVVLLFTAYPIFGAHFEPTHTWDDIWGYLFVTVSLLYLLRRQPITSGIFLSLAVIAREQNAVFIPVVLLGIWWLRAELSRPRLVVSLLLPLVISISYRLAVSEPQDVERFTFLASFNFESAARRVDTFASLIIAYGFLWVLSGVGFFQALRTKAMPYRRLLLTGLLLTLPVTVALTLVASFARETRIFFPPFVFVIPLSVIAIRSIVAYARQHWSAVHAWSWVLVFFLGMVAGAELFGEVLFANFDYKANSDLRGPLAGAYLGGFVILGCAWLFERLWRAIDNRLHHDARQIARLPKI